MSNTLWKGALEFASKEDIPTEYLEKEFGNNVDIYGSTVFIKYDIHQGGSAWEAMGARVSELVSKATSGYITAAFVAGDVNNPDFVPARDVDIVVYQVRGPIKDQEPLAASSAWFQEEDSIPMVHSLGHEFKWYVSVEEDDDNRCNSQRDGSAIACIYSWRRELKKVWMDLEWKPGQSSLIHYPGQEIISIHKCIDYQQIEWGGKLHKCKHIRAEVHHIAQDVKGFVAKPNGRAYDWCFESKESTTDYYFAENLGLIKIAYDEGESVRKSMT